MKVCFIKKLNIKYFNILISQQLITKQTLIIMKVLVAIKRVVDYSAHKIKIKDNAVDLSSARTYINPFCQIAMQEAANLKALSKVKEITALSIGAPNQKKILYGPLALGADKAIYVNTELRHDTLLQPLVVAKVLKYFVHRDKYDIVILGKQAVDDDFNQTGQMLAGLLDWPQATFASKIVVKDNNLEVTREIDTGMQTIRVKTPAVVTCDLRLNTPKIASLPNMMKAKKMPIEELDFKALNIPTDTNLIYKSVTDPAKRKGGVFVKDVDELLQKLQKEAKIL